MKNTNCMYKYFFIIMIKMFYKFHNSDRAVQTLSRVQVRQPIYNTSIGRWKHYEKYLDPLVDALKGTNNEK